MKSLTFRDFIKARYAELKSHKELKYSFRVFSWLAGFGSPNYLKLVMEGKRMISVEAIPKFANGLMLDEEQTKVFTKLALNEIAAKSHPVRAFIEETKRVAQLTEEL